jgi:hypothetical protein
MLRYSNFLEKESCKSILRKANDKEGIIISGVRAFDEIYGIIEDIRKSKSAILLESDDFFKSNNLIIPI